MQRRASAIVVVNQCATAKHVVNHSEDRLFVSGNDARGKNHRVIFIHGEKAVVIDRDARKRTHRLGLAAADQHNQFTRIKCPQILRTNEQAIRDAQASHGMRDFRVVHHAASNKSDLAADRPGNIHDLLDAVNGRRKTGHKDLARSRAAQFFDALPDRALAGRVAGPLDVGAVAEKRQHALLAIFRKRVEIERPQIRRRWINLEVAGVNHHAEGRANGQRHTIHRAVRDVDELNLERADFNLAPGLDLAKLGFFEQSVLFQTLAHQRQCELRAIDRHFEFRKDVGHAADVIFVAVRKNNRANHVAMLLQISCVGDDDIDAE